VVVSEARGAARGREGAFLGVCVGAVYACQCSSSMNAEVQPGWGVSTFPLIRSGPSVGVVGA